ncbi:hypothetical protein [Cupriavidus necator]|uniref:hypothetical protein n=1 Tax=Cupriavidus necator TaxID=106590 RepID=UPI0029C57B82|nr:hypothetical protein [Cupriavidus necator]MDX6007980.1 hypothetical protein [Cupriavidus necator]
MKKTFTCVALAVAASTVPPLANAADVQRQVEIAERGKNVMPFNLKATTHIFTKTAFPPSGVATVAHAASQNLNTPPLFAGCRHAVGRRSKIA